MADTPPHGGEGRPKKRAATGGGVVTLAAELRRGQRAGSEGRAAGGLVDTTHLLALCANHGKVSLIQARALLGLSPTEVSALQAKADHNGRVPYRDIAAVFHAARATRQVSAQNVVAALTATARGEQTYAHLRALALCGQPLSAPATEQLRSQHGLSSSQVQSFYAVALAVAEADRDGDVGATG